MVVALGPGKFYGSSLPRPRFLADGNLNGARVDPPLPVLDPLLSWANEAHWSMGGLSLVRHRLQGRIEGSIKKLRVQRDRDRSFSDKGFVEKGRESLEILEVSEVSEEKVCVSPVAVVKKKRARKLMEEFERVAAEEMGGDEEEVVGVFSRTRGRRSVGGVGEEGEKVRRISPRKKTS